MHDMTTVLPSNSQSKSTMHQRSTYPLRRDHVEHYCKTSLPHALLSRVPWSLSLVIQTVFFPYFYRGAKNVILKKLVNVWDI